MNLNVTSLEFSDLSSGETSFPNGLTLMQFLDSEADLIPVNNSTAAIKERNNSALRGKKATSIDITGFAYSHFLDKAIAGNVTMQKFLGMIANQDIQCKFNPQITYFPSSPNKAVFGETVTIPISGKHAAPGRDITIRLYNNSNTLLQTKTVLANTITDEGHWTDSFTNIPLVPYVVIRISQEISVLDLQWGGACPCDNMHDEYIKVTRII